MDMPITTAGITDDLIELHRMYSQKDLITGKDMLQQEKAQGSE